MVLVTDRARDRCRCCFSMETLRRRADEPKEREEGVRPTTPPFTPGASLLCLPVAVAVAVPSLAASLAFGEATAAHLVGSRVSCIILTWLWQLQWVPRAACIASQRHENNPRLPPSGFSSTWPRPRR